MEYHYSCCTKNDFLGPILYEEKENYLSRIKNLSLNTYPSAIRLSGYEIWILSLYWGYIRYIAEMTYRLINRTSN